MFKTLIRFVRSPFLRGKKSKLRRFGADSPTWVSEYGEETPWRDVRNPDIAITRQQRIAKMWLIVVAGALPVSIVALLFAALSFITGGGAGGGLTPRTDAEINEQSRQFTQEYSRSERELCIATTQRMDAIKHPLSGGVNCNTIPCAEWGATVEEFFNPNTLGCVQLSNNLGYFFYGLVMFLGDGVNADAQCPSFRRDISIFLGPPISALYGRSNFPDSNIYKVENLDTSPEVTKQEFFCDTLDENGEWQISNVATLPNDLRAKINQWIDAWWTSDYDTIRDISVDEVRTTMTGGEEAWTCSQWVCNPWTLDAPEGRQGYFTLDDYRIVSATKLNESSWAIRVRLSMHGADQEALLNEIDLLASEAGDGVFRTSVSAQGHKSSAIFRDVLSLPATATN